MYRQSSITEFLGLQRSTVGVLFMIILVGMGERMAERFLPKEFPTELDEIACLYQPLIKEIGETFYLSDLYKIAKENNFPHPHITFTAFRDAKILIPYGDGVFSWKPPKENTVSEND